MLREREEASSLQITRVLALLDTVHLRSLPVRKGTLKWPHNPTAANYRHHFYRQAAHALGWRERRQFHPEVHHFIKDHVWPDLSATTTTRVKRHAQTSNILEGKMGENAAYSYIDIVLFAE